MEGYVPQDNLSIITYWEIGEIRKFPPNKKATKKDTFYARHTWSVGEGAKFSAVDPTNVGSLST